ncbi:DUF3995 domain-containing protein [Streptomyces meridianus]|uniref:DUF3995 domain-containing protein n=1 Tax=Streptomyces meridianus TaxID=2938945 RepID=A0ABT0X3Q1_9ACTN|nr:DUF3995 domain-containing protein [Streptomyces meridianus]MCM2577167.1 DUF3995 domain-containing protein [Streptomyces meridianus]
MTSEGPVSAESDVHARERSQEAVRPAPRPVWVHSAFAFTLLFTAIHVYWAVGGTWGLPLAVMQAQAQATTKAANAVVSVIMVIGAVWVLALNHPVGRRIPAFVLLAPLWAGAVVCVSHAVFGFATKILYLNGRHGAVDFPVVPGVDAATAADSNRLSALQDILVFEPCFLIQGVLLALAARQFIRTPAGRRTWSVSVIVGIAVIDVFGAVLSFGDMHFAIS